MAKLSVYFPIKPAQNKMTMHKGLCPSWPDEQEHIRLARDASGKLALADRVGAGGPFSCLGCGRNLLFRRAHKRTRLNANGPVTFAVRGHFFHISGGGGCTGETVAHATAKALLVEHTPALTVQARCGGCDALLIHPLFTDDDQCRRVAEFRLPNGRVADVAILSEENVLRGVIEVHHQHACDDAKLLDLMDVVGHQWWEVRACDVIDAVLGGRVTVPVSTQPLAHCAACVAAWERRLDGVKARLLATRQQAAELDRKVAEMEIMNWKVQQATKDLAVAAEAHNRVSVHKQLVEAGGTLVIGFGKYRGVALEALVDTDPAYVGWIAEGGRGSGATVSTALVNGAKRLLAGRCYRCAETLTGDRPAWHRLCLGCWQYKRNR